MQLDSDGDDFTAGSLAAGVLRMLLVKGAQMKLETFDLCVPQTTTASGKSDPTSTRLCDSGRAPLFPGILSAEAA